MNIRSNLCSFSTRDLKVLVKFQKQLSNAHFGFRNEIKILGVLRETRSGKLLILVVLNEVPPEISRFLSEEFVQIIV